MSALDKLIDIFNAGGPSDPRFTLEEMAQWVLNMHAHELAERIRDIGVDAFEGMNDTARIIRQTRALSADLIDPEVDLTDPQL